MGKAEEGGIPAIALRETQNDLSLTAAEPPSELTLAFVGLWWDAKGDWKRAHESAQQDEGLRGFVGARL
jgi:hypothetical protein